MSDAPTLAILKLSESFGSVWADVAREAGATLLSMRPDDEPAEVAVVLVAAGGEEEQGLDVLRALADRWSAPLLLVG
ncbi:MAG: hypothetical protein OEW66_12695, partial [Actinomycetota bacterium]|nr:hypothetical protein [Actinomycetota bacterium]